MITGVIMNWKRPENVLKIVAAWEKDRLVSDAIIWNNNADDPVEKHKWARVINTQSDFGLYARFAAALFAKNDCILIQDDDFIFPTASIASFYSKWKDAPKFAHGRWGRGGYRPCNRPQGARAIVTKPGQPARMLLTCALMTHKQHVASFFVHSPYFNGIQSKSVPYGNGEDIIFSHVARLAVDGKKLPTHRIPVNKLDAPHAIHGRNNHYMHRMKLFHACDNWLKLMLDRERKKRR